MPQRVKEQPKDIEPANVSLPVIEEPERLEIGGTVYEEVGNCAQCGEKVYKWTPRNGETSTHEAIGKNLAVFVAFSHREPPGVYCQDHDPNIGHRRNSPILTPERQQVRLGDAWRPRA